MRYATIGGVLAAAGAAVLLGGGPAHAAPPQPPKKPERAKTYRAAVKRVKPDGAVEPGSEQKIYYSNGRARQENADGSYSVADPAAPRPFVRVDPAAKRAFVNKAGGPASVNVYERMADAARKAVADGTRIEKLGVKAGNGRQLKGYRWAGDPVGGLTPSSTFWFDAKDDTLVRYESVSVSRHLARVTKGKDGPEVEHGPEEALAEPVTTVMEFSGFGDKLDEKLFDTAVPAGYAVDEMFTLPPPPAAKKPAAAGR